MTPRQAVPAKRALAYARATPRLYCFFFSRSRHAGPDEALSTFYRGHRRDGFFLVGDNNGKVSLLDGAQGSVTVTGIRFVPVKAGEVFLRPRVLEDFAVARINFVAHLAHVFNEQARQQGARDRPPAY